MQTSSSLPHASGQEAHTVTPYGVGRYCHGNEKSGRRVLAGAKLIATAESRVDAAFIVRACNSRAANERKIAGLVALAQHVLDMADDAYLIGHPEWSDAIVPEARAVLALVLAQANEAQP